MSSALDVAGLSPSLLYISVCFESAQVAISTFSYFRFKLNYQNGVTHYTP